MAIFVEYGIGLHFFLPVVFDAYASKGWGTLKIVSGYIGNASQIVRSKI